MVVERPFKELDHSYEFGFSQRHFLHVFGGQPVAP